MAKAAATAQEECRAQASRACAYDDDIKHVHTFQ